jgi:hypothetical protein
MINKETYERIIHSKEFKQWFGDWVKPDRNTSKIVDKDGKPLIVYHGSPYKFTEFKYGENETSGQMGAEYAFWFSDNIKVAQHYSLCYPKSYYNERQNIINKYDELVKRDKIEFLKSLNRKTWDDLLKFVKSEYGDSAGYYSLSTYIKNNNWEEIEKMLIHLLFFVGRRNIDNINPKLSDFVDIEKKYEEETDRELENIKKHYESQDGYIYPCFIKATVIEEERGENTGVGLGRLPTDDSIHCKIIRMADTGSVFADEYVVTDPKRIKIATGENTIFNRKSKNIYEGNIIITDFKLFERRNDSEKLKFAEGYWNLFFEYCRKNIKNIVSIY